MEFYLGEILRFVPDCFEYSVNSNQIQNGFDCRLTGKYGKWRIIIPCAKMNMHNLIENKPWKFDELGFLIGNTRDMIFDFKYLIASKKQVDFIVKAVYKEKHIIIGTRENLNTIKREDNNLELKVKKAKEREMSEARKKYTYKGYQTRMCYSSPDNVYFGEIEDIDDLISFHSKCPEEFEDAFHNAVDEYISLCKELNVVPDTPKSDDKIYTIMVMTKCENTVSNTGKNLDIPHFGSTRLVGYFKSQKDAIYTVKHNICDIAECTYAYALIEEVKEGVYTADESKFRKLFKYNRETDCYEEIEIPEYFSNYGGFTIG